MLNAFREPQKKTITTAYSPSTDQITWHVGEACTLVRQVLNFAVWNKTEVWFEGVKAYFKSPMFPVLVVTQTPSFSITFGCESRKKKSCYSLSVVFFIYTMFDWQIRKGVYVQ